MKQLVGMAALLALATMPVSAQDAPAADKPEPITIRALVVPSESKNLVIGGEARVREDTLLRVSVALSRDSYMFGTGEIQTKTRPPFPRFAPVKRKKYRVEIPGTQAWGPGLYRVTVETAQDGGKTKVVKDVPCWSESLVRGFDDSLTEFDSLAEKAMKLIDSVNKAAEAGPKAFQAAKGETDRMRTHIRAISRSKAGKLYRIATGEVIKPLSGILGKVEYFKWDANGNFVGPNSYYGKGVGSQGKEFSFPDEAGYVRKAYEIAGREYALWIIREFRRKGAMNPSLVNSIRKHSEHAGLIDYATMLEGLTLENVDQIEAKVRKTPPPKEKAPATPPQEGDAKPATPAGNK